MYIFVYVCLLSFVVFSSARVVRYARLPMHLRWELYPIEGQGHPGGGSHFESQDWWTGPVGGSLAGELRYMGSEIFFFTRYFRRKRDYWYLVYPFHIGIFLLVGWLALLLTGALTQLAGVSVSASSTSAWGSAVYFLTLVAGVAGFAVATFGCVGLIIRRSLDREMRIYTAPVDYFNLAFVLVILVRGLTAWGFFDPGFAVARDFVKGLVTFGPSAGMNPATSLNIVLVCLFLAYMPFSSMLHYIAKYFTYHRVRWDERPNLKGSQIEKQASRLLGQPVSWSAPHIPSGQRWREVAAGRPGDGVGQADRGLDRQ